MSNMEFKIAVEIMLTEYENVLAQLDGLQFLDLKQKEFKTTITKKELELKRQAFELLFPFFVS